MTEHKNRKKSLKIRNVSFFNRRVVWAICFSIFLFAANLSAQNFPPPVPQRTPLPVPQRTPPPVPNPKPPIWKPGNRVTNDSPFPAEKSVKTEAKVNVTFCVSEGEVRVNGWDRDEIRAFVASGSKVGFKILEKSGATQNPVWVEVLGFNPATDKGANLDECLAGNRIEIDVPQGASVNIKSRASEIRFESVGKVRVENLSGAVSFHNVTGGIEAVAFEGDISVEDSRGAMSLFSTTGNIFAANVEGIEFNDAFKAKTRSGKITLQAVKHRESEVFSAAGTVRFDGEFARAGRYTFGTTNGSIFLVAPSETSCKISATYGFGAFHSEMPMTDTQKSSQRFTGVLGAGDCTLNLTTYSGAIHLTKK